MKYKYVNHKHSLSKFSSEVRASVTRKLFAEKSKNARKSRAVRYFLSSDEINFIRGEDKTKASSGEGINVKDDSGLETWDVLKQSEDIKTARENPTGQTHRPRDDPLG